jgi:phosphoribosylglycinamide formyltransferase-1
VTSRILVLASGSGSLLQALLDSPAGNAVVAVGSDTSDAYALTRAAEAGIAAFTVSPGDFATRADWNSGLLAAIRAVEPDLIVSAGFMRIIGAEIVDAYRGRIINTHPALLPAFPGAHGVRDAMAYGVKVTGCTVHFVDEGVDTGSIIAQAAVIIEPDDTEESLHERIKIEERRLLVDVVTQMIGAQ